MKKRDARLVLQIVATMLLGVLLVKISVFGQDLILSTALSERVFLPVILNVSGTIVEPTIQPSPSVTPMSTIVSTVPPVLTATPSSTALPTNTHTPSETPIATATSTSTETPTMTPSPTVTPCATLKGVISSNLTLTSGCHYEVNNNLLVSENVSLSIPSDVVVKFAPAVYLMVDGALLVSGTQSSPVVFTRNSTGYWGGTRITNKSKTHSSLNYLIFEYAEGDRNAQAFSALNVKGSQPKLTNLTFRFNVSPFYLSGSDLTTPNSENLTVVLSGGQVVSNTESSYLAFGVNIVENVRFEGNSHFNTDEVVSACPGNIIRNSEFINNNAVAIKANDCSGDKPTLIENNSIIENQGAIVVLGNYSVTVSHNQIISNTQISLSWPPDYRNIDSVLSVTCHTKLTNNDIYASNATYLVRVVRKEDCETDAKNNWWGTIETSVISDLIYDFYDDFLLGKVIFEPVSSSPNGAFVSNKNEER